MPALKNVYFSGKISPGFIALYTGRSIVLVAVGLLGLFLPIFFYNLFNQNFQLTIAYFGLGYLAYVVSLLLAIKLLNRITFRRAIQTSVLFGMLFYVALFLVNQQNLLLLIPLSIAALLIYRFLFWTPFHTDFALFTDKKNRSKEFSLLAATQETLGIIIPVIAGFLITRFGFDVLFIIAILLFLAAGIAYLRIPETKETFSWSVPETWRQFWASQNRGPLLAFMAAGAENLIGFVVWPIFIFLLLKGSYLHVGAISTLIIGATVVLQLLTGKHLDERLSKQKILKLGSVLYALGWILKIFIATAFQVFIVGAYHNFAKIFTRTPFQSLAYEIAADQGHYVDEFTVLREIAMNVGKTIMAILIIIISFFVAIQWVFLLGALASVFLNFLRARHRISGRQTRTLLASPV